MLSHDDLQAFKGIVREEIDPIKAELQTAKQQLDTVEMKVELVNKRVEQAQEETVNVLSDLIHTGYNLHERRLKKVEDNLKLPSSAS